MSKAVRTKDWPRRGALLRVLSLAGLAAAKGAAAFTTGSKALLSDACHSAADAAHAIAGLRDAHRPVSRSDGRPSGGEAVSVVLAALVMVAGLEAGLHALRALAAGPDRAPGLEAAAVIALSLALRGLLARVQPCGIRPGLRRARHSHDLRSDVLASSAALAGILGTQAGEWLGMPALFVLDPAAGLLVAALAVRSGLRLALAALRSNEDVVLTDGFDVDMLKETVLRMDGVVAVDDLKVREHGHYVVADLVVRVNPRITVMEAHDIAARVRRHLTRRFLHVADAIVRVQPYEPYYPYKTNLQDEETPTLLQ
ncbi:MAG TPA: cation diffusion facilitator family transporter [Paenibacillaceae bacterium]